MNLLERVQDQRLRIASGSYATSSTGMFKYLTSLSHMTERTNILTFKFIIRIHFLSEGALLSIVLRFVNASAPHTRFRRPTLCAKNAIWSQPLLMVDSSSLDDRFTHFISSANVRKNILAYRTQILTSRRQLPKPPALLA
ncbi:hypothetical protein G6F70_003339 [Rhizopus microsporus]|nr:hypothetical protein G6F71_005239 [Rhizopus microsporus]RCH94142.1 hypothetical protein CU097_013253 [Rhizopus azygosporus]KAG1201219.1 hypothetical protein G6F70_003339 [Rhizopus microsporus]KAG1210704.1 hypothetical protein G6F69_005236 [Rhizopus microsporus]KAG1235428.1 hypothetical protein G6F67_002758 [Rhizopus microsporus]